MRIRKAKDPNAFSQGEEKKGTNMEKNKPKTASPPLVSKVDTLQ